ncbi:MAG: HEAT repeat domain-containing protein, partial [Spirochaetota bacterium]
MIKHKIINFILNISNALIKNIPALFLIFILFFSINSVAYAQDNNTDNNNNEDEDTSENQTTEENDSDSDEDSEEEPNDEDDSADENNNDSDSDSEESSKDEEAIESETEDEKEKDTNEYGYERTIEYDETVTEADKYYYEQWEKDIKYGVSKKKLDIIKAIIEAKKAHFLPLLTLILEEESNPDVITQAIQAVLRLQYYEASEVILQYLDSENLKIQTMTVRTLGTFKYAPMGDRLEELLDTENISLKNEVILAIGRLERDEFTTELIDDLYYDPDTREVTQETILRSLGIIGNEESLTFLLDIYEDDTNSTAKRSIAFRGLIFNSYGDVKEHLRRAMRTTNITLKREALRASLYLDKEEIPLDIILSALKDDNAGIRVGALQVISQKKISNEEIIEFIKYIADKDPIKSIRYTAVGTFLSVAEEEALTYIEEKMNKGDKDIRYAISNLLGLLPEEKAIDYATRELNIPGKTEDEFKNLLSSIRRIENNAGLDLLIDIAKHPLDYATTSKSVRNYQLVLQELTKFKDENNKVHKLGSGFSNDANP